MKFSFRPMIFAAMALGLAAPTLAQDAAPAPTETPAAPAMTPDQYINNPEYMLNLDL
ncbi:MAG: hypothetical protein KIT23_11725 [Sphingopyxis sp.]|nr:hypothetical protein [Sphingopyxis sp.]